jgi:Predicted transcriptional regulator with C-terminal CBS domains
MTMPTRPLADLDRKLREDPEYVAALEERAPYEAIARQLIAFRIEHGLSQTELGKLCGVSQPAIARLESGDHEPRLATLRRVAHALDASLVLDLAFQKDGRREHLATL